MNKAKVLFYDIETAPNLAYVWGHYEQNVIAHVQEWYMMCFSYKWAGEKTTRVVALPDFKEAYELDSENDYHVAKKLWELVDEADVIVAHNGDKFDIRKANARFIVNKLGAPSPVQQIDTLKIARKYFMFNSNRLGDLGQHLDLGAKVAPGGFGLWKGCMMGDPKSWRKMKAYAKQDTVLLENIYLALRPWMRNHPSLNLMSGTPDACPVCNLEDSLVRRGIRYTKVSMFQQWHCSNCGSWSRTRVAEPPTVVDKPNYIS